MEAYQERVVAEKNELDERITKLRMFIESPGFGNIEVAEQKRMRRQELIMQLYSDVLVDRIENFS